MTNRIIQTFNSNNTWTCPAGVTSVTIIPGITKTQIAKTPYAYAVLGVSSNQDSYAWGDNVYGQLGTGSISTYSSPTLIVGGYNFQQLFIYPSGPNQYYNSSYGLLSDGTCYAWGSNLYGQLGDNTVVAKSSPIKVVGGYKFQQIAVAGTVSINGAHALGITSDGTCYAWGYNNVGQLGNGTDVLPRSSPTLVAGGNKFQQIFTSSGFSSYGLSANGNLYAWGPNTVGQLGIGNLTSAVSSPTIVTGGYNFKQIRVSSNGNSVLGLASDGNLYGWGANQYGQLGLADTTVNYSSPTLVLGGIKFQQFDINGASQIHSIGLTSSGGCYTWGNNQYGQLGLTDRTNRSSPVQVTGSFQQVYITNNSSSYGIDSNGAGYAWGRNDSYGELGLGDTTNRSTPVLVLGGYKFKKLFPTNYSFYGLTTSGVLYSCGSNTFGELGNGDVTFRSSPVLVAGGSIIETTTDNSRINDYKVTPGTAYTINLNCLPTFGNNIICNLPVDFITLEYFQ